MGQRSAQGRAHPDVCFRATSWRPYTRARTAASGRIKVCVIERAAVCPDRVYANRYRVMVIGSSGKGHRLKETQQRHGGVFDRERFTRCVVTGVAMTTALATNVDDTWKKLLDGQTGIRRLEDEFVEQSATRSWRRTPTVNRPATR